MTKTNQDKRTADIILANSVKAFSIVDGKVEAPTAKEFMMAALNKTAAIARLANNSVMTSNR
ncbi:MAG: hypothetical protein HRT95_00535 [Moritella sp.]|uniref:hypothetical protein n=1 Tax=Moritella sp. TaxID=78556 RepID=UPI001D9E81AB|nr:hypothetical protein [Moritella sp.]NQZ48704.1 hypothetical protein [Moritella sp.]